MKHSHSATQNKQIRTSILFFWTISIHAEDQRSNSQPALTQATMNGFRHVANTTIDSMNALVYSIFDIQIEWLRIRYSLTHGKFYVGILYIHLSIPRTTTNSNTTLHTFVSRIIWVEKNSNDRD